MINQISDSIQRKLFLRRVLKLTSRGIPDMGILYWEKVLLGLVLWRAD